MLQLSGAAPLLLAPLIAGLLQVLRISDPLVSEIEQELMPGRFVPYNDMYDFARHLEHVAEKIRALVEDGEAKGAVGLYELFLAGAYEKMEECDDSGASLSLFWADHSRKHSVEMDHPFPLLTSACVGFSLMYLAIDVNVVDQ